MKKLGTTSARNTTRQTDSAGEGRGMEVLDRLIGDALVGALILLGFALCVGAARAETASVSSGRPAIHVEAR